MSNLHPLFQMICAAHGLSAPETVTCPRCGEGLPDADCAEGCEDPNCPLQESAFERAVAKAEYLEER